jgi:cyanophycin synthetase
MKIVHTHRLESINYLSSERVVVADLGVPSVPPSREECRHLAGVLSSIPRPLRDKGWDDELVHSLEKCADWSRLIAACAQYLQRIVVRFDGAMICNVLDLLEPHSIAIECLEFEVGEACLQAGVEIASRSICDPSASIDSILEFVENAHEEYSLGSVTGLLVAAARRMKIPTRRLDGGSLIQLGHGMFQRRLRRSCTDTTGYVAELVSSDKVRVKSLWKEIGLPVAEGRAVASVEDALRALADLGPPVVIKPRDADYGDGVSVNLGSDAQVVAAFEKASAEGDSVMIERFAQGSSFRLLVLRGEVVSAVRRDPASVIGDGSHTVAQLIELENNSGKRGHDRRWGLYKLNRERVDEGYLGDQGMQLTSIPKAGQQVWFMRDISHTDGGSTHEVLERVHPQTLKYASLAAESIGIDLAGIDLVAQDISLPLKDQGGFFLEINAEPGIGLHLPPMCDRPRPIDEAIVNSLFAFGRPTRIPVVLAISDHLSVSKITRWLELEWPASEYRAMSTVDETLVGNMRIHPKSTSLVDRLQSALLHPRTAMVFAIASLDEVLLHGVGIDRLHTVLVANSLIKPAVEDQKCSPKIKEMMRQIYKYSDHVVGLE